MLTDEKADKIARQEGLASWQDVLQDSFSVVINARRKLLGSSDIHQDEDLVIGCCIIAMAINYGVDKIVRAIYRVNDFE
jgi:hypothetical protein